MIPNSIEFPLRASATVGEIQEFYGIQIDGPPERTLDTLMSHKLKNASPSVGETVTFGPLSFRVLRLSDDGRVEMVGMSLLPEKMEEVADYQ